MRHKRLVVQHCFGSVGAGGPAGALQRLLTAPIAEEFDFDVLQQEAPFGAISVRTIWRWARLLRRLQPDIVHVRGLGNEGFHGVAAARLAGCKRVLLSVHGTQRDLEGPATLRRFVVVSVLERISLMLATHVTTVCAATAEREFLRKVRKKLVRPYVNGVEVREPVLRAVDQRKRDFDLVTGDEVVLISVGRLTLQKGHGDLAAALSLIDPELREAVQVAVVGSGPESDLIRDLYSRSGVRSVFLGQRSDIYQLLGSADVFVLPSWHENLSNALLEAMACGLPPIATAVGGTVEVIRDGCGVLVPPHSPDALAEAIAALVEDSDRRQSMGRRARAEVRERYSILAMSEAAREIYSSVLGEVSS